MARINIEEKLFTDPRWMDLLTKVGCQYKAKGLLLTAWTIAQKHWLKSKVIPEKAWPKDLDVLIEVELATRRQDGSVYVKGSKKAFLWLEQKSRAGSVKSDKKIAGAEKARKVRKNKSEQDLNGRSDNASNNSERMMIGEERGETGLNGSEPPFSLLSSPSSSFSSLSSSSDSKKSSVPSEHSKKAQLFVAAYCQLFKARYGMNPKILGKDSGIASRLSKQLSEDDIKKFLTAFFSMPDAWLVKAKHPLGAFEMKLNEIVVFANSGNFTTKTQANQADAFATNAVLLDQVRRGEA